MPGPKVDDVEPSSDVPRRADVVIIGGGIIGTTTALELAERGLSVVLCEKGIVGGEQSSRNWGWVRMSRRDPRELDLMAASIRLWEGLSDRIGFDVGYRQCGIITPFPSKEAREKNEAWLHHIDETQHRISSIENDEVRSLLPKMNLQYEKALYAPNDGRAEPQRAAPAIARAAKAKGATILTNCAVRKIEVSGSTIVGVETERGRIATPAVVVAGGAWSRLLLREIGITLPQLKVVNSVLRTEPVSDGPDITVRGHFFSVRRREDGGYTVSTLVANDHDLTPDSLSFLPNFVPVLKREWKSVRPRIGRRFFQEWRDMQPIRPGRLSPFERTRILDPEPNLAMSNAALAHLADAFPVFKNIKVAQHWAGVIDFTPDVVPVISGVDGMEGLTIAAGFSGHGFGLGPGAGRLTADLVMKRTPIVDPTPFRFSRFSDGSEIIPLTGV